MRLTILTDNNASRNLPAEWGFSAFIEDGGQTILFDLGGSGLFIKNAAILKLDPLAIDFLVLSHGHWDHTWGLEDWIKQRLVAERPFDNRPSLIAHPLSLEPKFRNDMREFGVITGVATLNPQYKKRLSPTLDQLTENLIVLGEVQRVFEIDSRPLGKIYDSGGSLADDFLWDDTALAYKSGGGLVIISGCAHSGICNIVEHARNICGEERILDIIGGFHLMDLIPDDRKMVETINYFKKINPAQLHPCHCNDLNAKIMLAREFSVKEVRVGDTWEYL